jgi:YjbE family integral membrane protein
MFDPVLVHKFLEVIFIDIVMSGDNAIIIGLAVAGLAAASRKKIIFWGIVLATVLRVVLASIAVPLLKIIGLTLAGGILLAWVAWKFFREMHKEESAQEALEHPKTEKQAIMQIVLADLSMSLDNVLAVAGAGREHPGVLIFGLLFSVVLMGTASTYIANLISRFRVIAYIGLLVIVYVALEMIWSGWGEVAHALSV